jgi:hypothetical protein
LPGISTSQDEKGASVTDIGPATENEMILAFLRAEIDSSRFGTAYAQILSNSRIDRQWLIDRADLNSDGENRARKELLGLVRGFGNDSFLFRGFPPGVQWRRVGLEPTDWNKVKYANYPTWVSLSGGTRVVADGAKNIDSVLVEDANENIKAVAAGVRSGKRYAELIGVDGVSGDIILAEGHTRATAYALAQLPKCVECIVGSSPNMATWAFY